MLRFRAALLWRLRQFFEDRGFLEVETPILSHDAVADLHIDPIPVLLLRDARDLKSGRAMWLQTSPEFGMKRLLAAGAQRIYQVTKAFRTGECGARHNPEFTIAEWYQVGDSLQAGMELLADLARALLAVEQVETLSYESAFTRHVGVNPHTATPEQFAERARRLHLAPPANPSGQKDDWLNYLLAECVEPNLGQSSPVILYDYPATQAALAQVRTVSPHSRSNSATPQPSYQVAERFELYFHGVELAHGYHELLDADELRERTTAANRARQIDGRYPVPEASRLLDAMDHGLPPCSGAALGFDRLVMVAAGKTTLADVIAFPIDRS
jgi:lysyl-tRNA synthetase class 2